MAFHAWNSDDLRALAVRILQPPKDAKVGGGGAEGGRQAHASGAVVGGAGSGAGNGAGGLHGASEGGDTGAHPSLVPSFVIIRHPPQRTGDAPLANQQPTGWEERKARVSAVMSDMAPRMSAHARFSEARQMVLALPKKNRVAPDAKPPADGAASADRAAGLSASFGTAAELGLLTRPDGTPSSTRQAAAMLPAPPPAVLAAAAGLEAADGQVTPGGTPRGEASRTHGHDAEFGSWSTMKARMLAELESSAKKKQAKRSTNASSGRHAVARAGGAAAGGERSTEPSWRGNPVAADDADPDTVGSHSHSKPAMQPPGPSRKWGRTHSQPDRALRQWGRTNSLVRATAAPPAYFRKAERMSALLGMDVGFLEPSPLEASLMLDLWGDSLVQADDGEGGAREARRGSRITTEEDDGGGVARATGNEEYRGLANATKEDLLVSRAAAREAIRTMLVKSAADATLEWLMSLRCEKAERARSEEVLLRVFLDHWFVWTICTAFFAWVRRRFLLVLSAEPQR